MKLKFLLFAVLISGILNAQDTIRSLIITEAHLGSPPDSFIEITNMGEEAVQLADFRLGQTAANTFEPRMNNNPFTGEKNVLAVYQLPERMLQPGESFVLAMVSDYGREAWLAGIEGYSERPTNLGIIEVADVQLHHPENNPPSGDGTNRNFAEDGPFFDVAGLFGAGNYGRLMRRFTVKTGNLNFADARGVGVDDSEWIVVPDISHYKYRMIPWTIGNHGDYNLDENTLTPTLEGMSVDFANRKITVPWGVLKI